ncbi:MAG: TonB-dependent receptor domain-containing protein [Permianibacter sp.]
MVVTGTHIKRIDQETSSPVVVIDRTAIEGSGAVTLHELLQMSPYNGAGSFNESFTTGFTPGAAAFDLRSLGAERTLVLVNGKRQPMYPFGAGGSNAFVDLNSIPLATVKRVEILKDGASALYGSDAVAGVVNIITYDSFSGTEVAVRGKTTEHGGADTGALSLLHGGETEQLNWLIGVDASHRDELLGADRDYAKSLRRDLGELGIRDDRDIYSAIGWQLNSATGEFSPLGNCAAENRYPGADVFGFGSGDICLNDYASQMLLLPETDRASIDGKLGYDFGWAKLSIHYGLVGVDTRSTGFHTSIPYPTDGVNIGQVENINGVNFLTVRRLTELGTPTIDTESLSQQLAMDWQWQLSDYDFNLALYRHETEIDETLSEGWLHVNDYIRLQTDIANNVFSIRNPLTAAQVDDYTSEFWHQGESTVTAQELRMSGPLVDTVRGPIWLAAGLEHRKETFFDRSEQAILDGDVVGYGTSGAEGERSLTAAYVETAIPLSDTAELSLSLRQDDYSDFGSSTNPKLGLRVNPTDELLFRLSWGTGFRAPSMHQLYTKLNLGSAGNLPFVQSGNPDLEPEESESVVVGVLFEPESGSEVSFDLWSIDVDNIISNLGARTIADRCLAGGTLPDFCVGRIIEANQAFTAWDGSQYTPTVRTYNDSFLNLAGRKAFGADLGFAFRFNRVAGGVLKWQTELSRLINLEGETYPGAGISEQEGNSGNPLWRAKMSLHWQGEAITHFLAMQYLGDWDYLYSVPLDPDADGDFDENDDGFADFSEERSSKVDAFYQFDYQFGYALTAEQRIVFGIQNLTDEEPPVSSLSWPFFNQSLYSPMGRSASLEWQGRF